MSRRKQSNPKPIKRSSEEDEENSEEFTTSSSSSSVIFPDDSLCLQQNRETQSDTVHVVQRSICEGTRFGPYKLNDDGGDSVEIKFRREDGIDDQVILVDDVGEWIKYVTQIDKEDQSNIIIEIHDCEITCTITEDLEIGTELKGLFRECSTDRGGDANMEKPNLTVKVEPRSPSDNCEEQPSSSSNKSCAVMKEYEVKSEQLHEETQETHNIIPGLLKHVCLLCGIVFSSQSTLVAHQSFYCVHRKRDDDDSVDDVAVDEEDENYDDGDASNDRKDELNTDQRSKRKKTSSESVTTSSNHDNIDVKNRKTGYLYSCPYCSYTSDKKSSLTRHMRIHASSPPSSKPLLENQMLAAAAMAERHLALMRSYCSQCDIQFSSHKNFSVHKQFYCNTRRVQQPRTVPATSPTMTSPKSPIAQSSLSLVQPGGTHILKPWNIVQQNAFASSPLILVPCSYVPGKGLIPASNIMLQNGEEFMPNVGMRMNDEETSSLGTSEMNRRGRSSPKSNVSSPRSVKTETVVSPTTSNNERDSVKVVDKESVRDGNDFSVAKESVDTFGNEVEPKGNDDDDDKDVPLDLSISKATSSECDDVMKSRRKEIGGETFKTKNKMNVENMNAVKQMQLNLLSNEVASNVAGNSTKSEPRKSELTPSSSSTSTCGMPVLVKQGVSKCTECNIVFYKHENYLAHKQFYCSSRLGEVLGQCEIKERRDDCAKSSIDPNRSDEKTSVNESPASLIQFFCVPCGIKFTSIKNLHAHQTYYCPKRETLFVNDARKKDAAASSSSPSSSSNNFGGSSDSSSESPFVDTTSAAFTCISCKVTFVNELELRKHICSPAVLPASQSANSDMCSPPLPQTSQSNVLRCLVCGYRGHTLRGMKSHVRSHMVHIDGAANFVEEDVYAFVVCEKQKTKDGLDLIFTQSKTTSPPNGHQYGELGYSCDVCSYTSSYRGNVVRHKRLVHKDRKINGEAGGVNASDDANNDRQQLSPDEEELSVDGSSPVPELVKLQNNNNNNNNNRVAEDASADDVKTKNKRYCNSCQVSFSYLPSFIAHKQFYCRNRSSRNRPVVEEQEAT